ncbi:hypothetical protein ACJX0J_027690, partial [Zea mays]
LLMIHHQSITIPILDVSCLAAAGVILNAIHNMIHTGQLATLGLTVIGYGQESCFGFAQSLFGTMGILQGFGIWISAEMFNGPTFLFVATSLLFLFVTHIRRKNKVASIYNCCTSPGGREKQFIVQHLNFTILEFFISRFIMTSTKTVTMA